MTVGRQRLHQGGPELSRLVWGAWRALKSSETDTPGKLARLLEGCLELGITSFDLADIYGGYQAEALFGAALQEWGGDRRRIELVEPGVTPAPIHYESAGLDVEATAALVAEARASIARASATALEELTASMPTAISSLSLRALPEEFPEDVAVQRQPHVGRPA